MLLTWLKFFHHGLFVLNGETVVAIVTESVEKTRKTSTTQNGARANDDDVATLTLDTTI